MGGFVGGAAAQVGDGGARQAQVGGVEVVGADGAIFQVADAVDAARVEFVGAASAMNDERGTAAQAGQDVRERLSQCSGVNAG